MRRRWVLAALVLAWASTSAAQPFTLTGSDTMWELATDALAACPHPSGGSLGDQMLYVGAGSGLGGQRMVAGTQQIALQSRFLSSPGGECGSGNTGQSIRLGLDAIGIWKD